MFKERSAPYNEENLKYAFAEVEQFTADYGGTVIYEPLDELFKKPKNGKI